MHRRSCWHLLYTYHEGLALVMALALIYFLWTAACLMHNPLHGVFLVILRAPTTAFGDIILNRKILDHASKLLAEILQTDLDGWLWQYSAVML